jgi:hypothetical protein
MPETGHIIIAFTWKKIYHPPSAQFNKKHLRAGHGNRDVTQAPGEY